MGKKKNLNRNFSKEDISIANKAHKRMLKVISHQRDENQNHRDIKPQRLTITSISEDGEKLEPSYTAGGNLKWCRCCGKYSASS